MGKRKINLKQIKNKRLKQIALCKRKRGLIKKIIELSILCDCEILLYILSPDKSIGPVFFFSSCDIDNNISQNNGSIKSVPEETFSLDDYDQIYEVSTRDD